MRSAGQYTRTDKRRIRSVLQSSVASREPSGLAATSTSREAHTGFEPVPPP